MRNQQAQCIYCLENKPERAFNVEHVLPAAFGDFQNALTLASPLPFRVCTSCNQRLGDSLDLTLGRDSLEAVLRALHSLTDADSLKGFRYRHVVISIPRDHELAPMLVQLLPNADGTAIGCVPMSQLRVTLADGQKVCIRERDIKTRLPAILAQRRLEHVEMFCAPDDTAAFDRIRTEAAAAGLDYLAWKTLEERCERTPHEVSANLRFTIDALVCRAVAKIGFEYFVWRASRVNRTLVNHDKLQRIRRFVLEGVGDWRQFVSFVSHRPTNEEPATTGAPGSHTLTLRWNSDVVASVSLFNAVIYRVNVCEAPSPVWQPIDGGHTYDLPRAKVTEIPASRIIQAPSRATKQ